MFDFSDHLIKPSKKLVIGKIKDETEGVAIEECKNQKCIHS